MNKLGLKIPNIPSKSDDIDCQLSSRTSEKEKDIVIGYFINFGVTSWRIFEVLRNTDKELREVKVEAYAISDPTQNGFLECIIETAISALDYIKKTFGTQFFVKAFADYNINEVFKSDKQLSDFTKDFYLKTHLCFNIISQRQTEENLIELFGDLKPSTAIINIGMLGVDVLVKTKEVLKMFSLPISINSVLQYIDDNNVNEVWHEKEINKIKNFIINKLPQDFRLLNAKNAFIIKGEYTFMKNKGYRLRRTKGHATINIDTYKEYNRKILFNVDYKKKIQEQEVDEPIKSKEYAYKIGHIIIESIFESLSTENVFPSDKLSIHGNSRAYIFNVVVGGSISDCHKQNMYDACILLNKMGAEVSSPIIADGQLQERTSETDYEHACAIRECDLLFVSNKDGYFGEQTRQQIYGAFLLKKPIAFWKEPTESELERLSFIPHEEWYNFMKVFECNNKN